ncbi:hypothetical protein PR202_ga00580 [Eleusine coracana subsp. coracana]|uniref:Uncharacterized protein n=1 Tax=Eleusine coracana subsp. coracana TaxID=191504 RepID=A0AAV5BE63_ELECO|nr:hypothetical protein PR202_ga00580 [Eleusine coracana subsp. coracana]
MTNDEDIAACFINYFSDLFTSSVQNHKDAQNTFRRDCLQIGNITQPPSKEEILNIIKIMRGNAAPSPDGFNITFYRAAWNWIGDDVYHMVRAFYTNKLLPDSIKKTNIVLIPKKLICSTPL